MAARTFVLSLPLLIAIAAGNVCDQACQQSVALSTAGHCLACTAVKLECGDAQLAQWCPAFMNLGSLVNVSLWGNRLGPQIGKQLSELHNVTQLDLHDNLLVNISADELVHMVQLEMLDLSRNHLKDLPDRLFATLTHLVLLDLDNNDIAHFQPQLFPPHQNLVSLNELHLAQNRLSVVPLGALTLLPSLTFLDLSRNRIDKLPPLHHDKLETLLLDGMSNLRRIDAKTFANLPKLRVLHLAANRLVDIDPNAFGHADAKTHNAPKLERLDLMGNPLTRLPREALDWQHLQWLAVQGIPFTCTCPMRWALDAWRHVHMERINDTRCFKPPHLRGRVLMSLSKADMPCADDTTTTSISTSASTSQTTSTQAPTTTTKRQRRRPEPSKPDAALLIALGAVLFVLVGVLALAVLPLGGERESYGERMWRNVKHRHWLYCQDTPLLTE